MNWYKIVQNENKKNIKVLDLEKIKKEGHNVNIILSERARQGKTFNAFEYIIDTWLTKKHKSVFLLNTLSQFDYGKEKMIMGNKNLYPDRWKDVKLTEKGLYDKDKVLFCYFVSISSYSKLKIGTRDTAIRTIIYDEFNEGLDKIKSKQSPYFDNILHSCNKNVVVFIFGNKLTINVPLLTEYKITSINKEVEIKKIGHMSILFYVPKTTKEMKEQLDKEKNWIYSHSKLIGTYDMSVLNKGDFDNNIGVVPKDLHYLWTIKTTNRYIQTTQTNKWLKMWKNHKNKWFLELKRDKDEAIVIYSRFSINAFNTVYLSVLMRQELIQDFMNGNVYFDSFVCKSLFFEAIS